MLTSSRPARPIASPLPRPYAGSAAFAALFLLACLVYQRILELNPFSADNVQGLFWADGAPASTLPLGDPVSFPGWRPLADLAQWLYYRWFHLDHQHAPYVINLLLWTACAWLVGQIVYRLTCSRVPALIAAGAVLVDQRAVVTIIVQEHASSLACFFGLVALLIVIRARDTRLTNPGWIALSLVLLASGLSKEYGMAFTGAVAASSLLERRRDTATAAITAAATYVLLRIGFAGGALAQAPFCVPSGYFFTVRTVCFDGINAGSVTQAVYNVAATAVGSVVPGLFGDSGQIGIAPRWVAVSAVWLAAMVVGFWKARSQRRLMLLVVVFNSALSFLLFRDRDQVVALCALGVAVGLGLAVANVATQGSGRRLIRAMATAVLLAVLTSEALSTREVISSEVADSHLFDPCEALAAPWRVDLAFVKRIKTLYEMPNPGCVPAGHER